MPDFDAVVVGSGCAGPFAARELAKAGKSVLVIERGNTCGAKNMSGGRLYMHAMRSAWPDLVDDAPVERRITHERISMLAPDADFTIDFTDTQHDSRTESFSVLRARLDPWMAQQAEVAGAEYINGIAVESLLKQGSRVIGVKAGDDEITADVVILCDGVNSLLTESAVGAKRPDPRNVAVGIKQVIGLPAQVISDRLLCRDDEGAAWLFVGDATHGSVGGGFVYTNLDTISIGLVATVDDLYEADKPIYQMLEDFKQHCAVAPLIASGEVLEHSGHMVAEGGFDTMPPLIGDGVLLAGESAMMCINAGYTVRGMDFAMAAGHEAGKAAVRALDAKDTSTAGLASYRTALEKSFVLQDLRTVRRFPHFMETTPRMFTGYPEMVRDMMRQVFAVDGEPMKPMMKRVMPALKKVGLMHLLSDGWKGVRSL